MKPANRQTLSRRQVIALVAAFGVQPEAFAQDATRVDPRSYRAVLENDRVRVLEYRSRPGTGVCGEGVHSHPAHLTVVLTGGKIKVVQDGKTTINEVPSGAVVWEDASTHSVENIGGPGTRLYLIEIKDKDWKPSTV